MALFQKRPVDPDSSFGNIIWASSLGIHLLLCAILGFFVGRFIDGIVHTPPVFAAIFFLLGMIAGFKEIFKQMELFKKPDEKSGKHGEKGE